MTTASYTAQSTQLFGFALLGTLDAGQENVCISPISVDLSMQLALYGARGNTAVQMIKALGITAPTREILAADANELIRKLHSPPEHRTYDGPGAVLKIALANSIWVHEKVKLNPDYATAMQTQYAAVCANLNFGDSQSVVTINQWVDRNTEHKIPQIISELHPDNMLVLVNCAYFKGTWSQKFSLENTVNREFHLANNDTVGVPTMRMEPAFLPYFQDDTAQVVEMNYTDKRFSMYVVLPAQGTNLGTFVSNLTLDRWQSWLSQLQQHKGVLSLPKFKTECIYLLNKNLNQLGMIDAFSGQADFSSMLAESLPLFCIDVVIHKTFIDVDEEGTEAAAATAIIMWGSAGSMKVPPPFEMIVERPFLYAVCENTTGTILFMGTVNDPRN